METFESFGWRWPKGVDYERSFRLDIIDHDIELVVRGELPGVEKDDIAVTIMGGRLMLEAETEFEEEPMLELTLPKLEVAERHTPKVA